MKESACHDILPSPGWIDRACGHILGTPAGLQSFRKAVSAVMDDLKLYDSIIDNLHLLSLCVLYVNNWLITCIVN